MARPVCAKTDEDSGKKAWLSRADAVKRVTPQARSLRHARSADASVERVRELAGVITLNRPVPSAKFLEDED